MNPQDIQHGLACLQQARALRNNGRLEGADALYSRTGKLLPASDPLRQEHALLRLLLAKQSLQQGKLPQALMLATHAANALPGHTGAMLMLALCLKLGGQHDKALAIARQVLATSPCADAAALQLACLLETGQQEALAAAVEQAREQFPGDWQVRHLCAEHLLRSGDWSRGWADAEFLRPPGSREQHPVSRLAYPDWDGKTFPGTLLIGGEQGLGDQVLAASVFAELAASGQDAVIGCDARLLPLFRRSFPTLRFVAQNQNMSGFATPDSRKLLLSDLPRFFRRAPADFPERRHWLAADTGRAETLRARYRQQYGNRRLVGLAWSSHRNFAGGSKSLPLQALAPLLTEPRLACLSLQHGDIAADLVTIGPLADALHRDPTIDPAKDIDGLCAQLIALDHVVTCSTSVAHFAGALGVPVSVLLPQHWPVLWYWGYSGDSTPWYRSARLWRCPAKNDWEALVRSLSSTLLP